MSGKIGIIGLGLMGSAFARRLIDANFEVLGIDISADRCEALRETGGSVAGSLSEIGENCDVILMAVMTIAQVEEVMEQEGGLIDSFGSKASDKVVLSTITAEPDVLEKLAGRVAEKGVQFLDTPVSGTSLQVQNGDGLGLIAGNKEAIEKVQPVLDAIYPRQSFTGPAGTGTKTKLAINHILGLNRVGLAEGLVFADRLGLDLENFLEIAKASAAYSQIMDIKGQKMVQRDFTTVGKVVQHLKDFRIIRKQAEMHDQQLPMASTLISLLEACEEHGDGDKDNSITFEEIRRRRVSDA